MLLQSPAAHRIAWRNDGPQGSWQQLRVVTRKHDRVRCAGSAQYAQLRKTLGKTHVRAKKEMGGVRMMKEAMRGNLLSTTLVHMGRVVPPPCLNLITQPPHQQHLIPLQALLYIGEGGVDQRQGARYYTLGHHLKQSRHDMAGG